MHLTRWIWVAAGFGFLSGVPTVGASPDCAQYFAKQGAEAAAAAPSASAAPKTPPPLILVKKGKLQYQGLTAKGIKVLQRGRDAIRSRLRLFETKFRNLTSVHTAALIARLFKGNMFLYGPPGGAKSALVHWLLEGEGKASFQLQVHQMISEQAFTGGQDFEAAKLGHFKVNTQGSLADYVVALVDETDKGNPAALAALLSLLQERKVLAGNRVIDARLETLFATSNANLAEILQQFTEGGQRTTAPAFLNRFQFKAFVYNWLSADDQASLDLRHEQERFLRAVLASAPEQVQNNELFLKPAEVPWDELRQIANALFKPSPLFQSAYRELVNEMRVQTHRAIRESEERHAQNHLDESFVYFPSADYTERLRQQIPDVILLSVFMDFLTSPLADDESLAALTAKQIELDPLSLWRAYLVMTTLGPGETRLKLAADGTVDLDFGWRMEAQSARDKREELLILNLQGEQDRFRRVLFSLIEKISAEIGMGSRSGSDVTGSDVAAAAKGDGAGQDKNNPPKLTAPDRSFEVQLLRSKGD